MFNIPGRLIIAYLDEVPIFCGTNAVFSKEKELIEATTITSLNSFQEFRLRKRSFRITVTGLSKVDSSDGQMDYFTLLGLDPDDQQPISLVSMDDDGNTNTIASPCYILESSITGPAEEWAEASVTFVGEGSFTNTDEGGGGISSTPEPPFKFINVIQHSSVNDTVRDSQGNVYTVPNDGTPVAVKLYQGDPSITIVGTDAGFNRCYGFTGPGSTPFININVDGGGFGLSYQCGFTGTGHVCVTGDYDATEEFHLSD